MKRKLRSYVMLLSGLLLAAGMSFAQNFDLDELAQVDVLPGWKTANGNHMAAIRVRLAPGWYTYWRQPGDTGIPPLFDWSGSTNLGAARVHWPAPVIIRSGSSSSIGYYEQVIWPIELTPTGAGPISLDVDMQIGVCEEVCIPADFTVQLTLPEMGQQDARIVASLANVPVAGQGRAECRTAPISDGLRLSMRFPGEAAQVVERVVIETGDPEIWVSKPRQEMRNGYWHSVADMVPPDGQPFALAGNAVRMSVFADNGMFEYLGCAGY